MHEMRPWVSIPQGLARTHRIGPLSGMRPLRYEVQLRPDHAQGKTKISHTFPRSIHYRFFFHSTVGRFTSRPTQSFPVASCATSGSTRSPWNFTSTAFTESRCRPTCRNGRLRLRMQRKNPPKSPEKRSPQRRRSGHRRSRREWSGLLRKTMMLRMKLCSRRGRDKLS